MDTANVYCRIFFDVLIEQGVGTAVCSPGSRNTPLLMAAAAREEEELIKCVVINDERVAAFTALGISLASRRPVILVCTSGSALLNYAPAVAEAYYRGVPLVILSADRPEEWIDQDDSQTIRQSGALSGIVKASYSFPALPSGLPDKEWYANRMANEAIMTALSGKPGPVHINIALDNPLNAATDAPLPMQRLISLDRPDASLPAPVMRELLDEARGARILLVAGFHSPDHTLNEAVARFASLQNVAVMAENLSNLHLHGDASSVDATLIRLSDKEREALRPDIVISIGGALVSRKLKEYLRTLPPSQHWSVGHSPYTADCFKCLTRKIETSPAPFLRKLAGMMRHTGVPQESTARDYATLWRAARLRSRAFLDAYVEEAPWSELKLFSILSRSLPAGCNLFLSNGTAVRYAQLFPFNVHAIFCNRGVSGIDGATSTAIGGALAYGGMTVLITGDMSLAYDLGAFASHLMPERMRIIAVNNAGGGIFRFIPSTRDLPAREKFFCSDPALPVEGITRAFGLEYLHADSESSLHAMLPRLLSPAAKATLLEVSVDPALSSRTLLSLFQK
ncbi:MAG: 2-succinyl-5-enolpyruvyl-6-hydroxy-3-cyclohexene-1-carboxylic-acid synthase [Muribaculaceae bacterium]|nr:2-succinyl-5-enolpyruvyl-6-hydroxy-3-cyclohexene-1-carboxylic-acid synthase [Muribaculaceae bacterium]